MQAAESVRNDTAEALPAMGRRLKDDSSQSATPFNLSLCDTSDILRRAKPTSSDKRLPAYRSWFGSRRYKRNLATQKNWLTPSRVYVCKAGHCFNINEAYALL